MADRGRAPAGRPMTWVWMVLALLVVGGFLTWLSIASEPTTVVVVDDNGDPADPTDPDGMVTVQRDTMAANPGRFLGQQVRVSAVPATSVLGPAIFWGELGDMERQIPILIRMDAAVAGAIEIRPGVEYTISGEVQRVTEELVESWGEQDEFRGAGEQMQATFADYYIQASAVRQTGGAQGR